MEFSIVWYSTVQCSALLQHGTVLSYPYCTAIFPPIIFTPPEIEIQKWSDPEMTSSRNRNPEIEIQKWKSRNDVIQKWKKYQSWLQTWMGYTWSWWTCARLPLSQNPKGDGTAFGFELYKSCQCNLPLFSKGWGEEQTIESPPVCPLAHIPGNYPVLLVSESLDALYLIIPCAPIIVPVPQGHLVWTFAFPYYLLLHGVVICVIVSQKELSTGRNREYSTRKCVNRPVANVSDHRIFRHGRTFVKWIFEENNDSSDRNACRHHENATKDER